MDYSSTILKYRYFLPKSLTYFYHRRFSFHVSFLCFNSLKIKRFKRWNIGIQCFIFGFNVSFLFTTPLSKKLSGRKIKPQWERFKTSMGEKSNPNGRNTTETLKSKMKHRMPMFHLLKVLIINVLHYKNETWNKKRLKVNIMYARVRSAFNWVQCVLTSKRRVLTWGRRVPEAADKIAFYRVKVFLFELF